MREHLSANPGDGGGSRYTWADTGLDAEELRRQVRPYQERFSVPTEVALARTGFRSISGQGHRYGPTLRRWTFSSWSCCSALRC